MSGVEGLKEALEFIAEGHDVGRHDGLPEDGPAHDADTMFAVARAALSAIEGGGQGSLQAQAPSVPTEDHDAAVLDRVQWLCKGAQPSDYAEAVAAIRETVAPVDYMVDRFLTWRLPDNFNPDGGVSFDKGRLHPAHWPVGTNLLDHTQATAMVRHMIGAKR